MKVHKDMFGERIYIGDPVYCPAFGHRGRVTAHTWNVGVPWVCVVGGGSTTNCTAENTVKVTVTEACGFSAGDKVVVRYVRYQDDPPVGHRGEIVFIDPDDDEAPFLVCFEEDWKKRGGFPTFGEGNVEAKGCWWLAEDEIELAPPTPVKPCTLLDGDVIAIHGEKRQVGFVFGHDRICHIMSVQLPERDICITHDQKEEIYHLSHVSRQVVDLARNAYRNPSVPDMMKLFIELGAGDPSQTKSDLLALGTGNEELRYKLIVRAVTHGVGFVEDWLRKFVEEAKHSDPSARDKEIEKLAEEAKRTGKPIIMAQQSVSPVKDMLGKELREGDSVVLPAWGFRNGVVEELRQVIEEWRAFVRRPDGSIDDWRARMVVKTKRVQAFGFSIGDRVVANGNRSTDGHPPEGHTGRIAFIDGSGIDPTWRSILVKFDEDWEERDGAVAQLTDTSPCPLGWWMSSEQIDKIEKLAEEAKCTDKPIITARQSAVQKALKEHVKALINETAREIMVLAPKEKTWRFGSDCYLRSGVAGSLIQARTGLPVSELCDDRACGGRKSLEYDTRRGLHHVCETCGRTSKP